MSTPGPAELVHAMDFAAMLRALMDERGLGVRALAGRVPCDKALISRLANGRARPSRQMARRLDGVLGGDGRLRAYALSAEAHHVAASVLLKLGEHGLAPLAADRSMQAARASEDPLAAGCSARIVTHALMAGGHLGAAVSTARGLASQLDTAARPADGEALSVYGALLLRGAIAAAQGGDRGAAAELLGEAGGAATRLGGDANLRWTAFGPANVAAHKVSVAVMLGDAGTAVETARTVDLDRLAVTERKAALLVDTARAFLMWGKHEKAYTVLRAAEQVAPAEVTARPAVHRLARDLATSAPPSLRRHARDFAARLAAPQ